MFVCVCVHVCGHMCVWMYVCCVYVCVFIYVIYVYVCVHVYVRVSLYAVLHTPAPLDISMRACDFSLIVPSGSCLSVQANRSKPQREHSFIHMHVQCKKRTMCVIDRTTYMQTRANETQ